MSEKLQLPTFRVYTTANSTLYEGPVVAPDKASYAVNLQQLHAILTQHHAVLVYAGQWVYLPQHSIGRIERGQQLFNLPWPLTDE